MKVIEIEMTVCEMAQHYYPRLWDINRINALYEAGKLTEEEYKDIVGETPTEK